MDARPALIEFPADDPERAVRFWTEVLGQPLDAREASQGGGWQTAGASPAAGVSARGRGAGHSAAPTERPATDLPGALERVASLGGTVVHPGDRWAVCRDSEG